MSQFDKIRRQKPHEIFLYLPPERRRPAILLSANTVKALHGVVPREILGREWWDKTRMEAYRSTQFHCLACGVHKSLAQEHQWLEGHELYRINYRLGRMTYVETVPLCHYCHSYIHDGRLRALYRNGEVTREKLKAVLQHGFKVLHEAGIRKPPPYMGIMAPWEKWRLVLFDKLYPPLYATYEEWERVYGAGWKGSQE